MRILIAFALVAAMRAVAADALGPFEGSIDVGTMLHPGTGQYEASGQQFTISSGGENMWAREDDFHFLWKKMSGDVAISAAALFPHPGGNAHRKAILMIRQTLDTDSPYVDAARHGDGLTSLQSRDTKGGLTREVGTAAAAPSRLRLEKRGDYFFLYMARDGDPLHLAGGSMKLVMTEPFYVGIGVCAHDKNAIETVVFSDVKVEQLPRAASEPKLYSTLETVVVTSTDRRVTYVAPARIESPAWSTDGKSLSFLQDGSPRRIPAEGGNPVDAPDLPRAGKMIDVSPDGESVYFASTRSGSSQIWKVNPNSGEAPVRVTSGDELQNFQPYISPDGKRLVFLSSAQPLAKDSDVQLQIMNLADGKLNVIAKLIGGRTSIGPGAWSADGKKLTFVSYQYLHE